MRVYYEVTLMGGKTIHKVQNVFWAYERNLAVKYISGARTPSTRDLVMDGKPTIMESSKFDFSKFRKFHSGFRNDSIAKFSQIWFLHFWIVKKHLIFQNLENLSSTQH